MSADGEGQKARTEQHDIRESAEEARLNRGFVTVLEATKDRGDYSEGERYFVLGKETERHVFDEEEGDFVRVAVPIAHIELPEVLAEGELTEYMNSDLGKLALQHFFPEVEAPDVLTRWGEGKVPLEVNDG